MPSADEDQVILWKAPEQLQHGVFNETVNMRNVKKQTLVGIGMRVIPEKMPNFVEKKLRHKIQPLHVLLLLLDFSHKYNL